MFRTDLLEKCLFLETKSVSKIGRGCFSRKNFYLCHKIVCMDKLHLPSDYLPILIQLGLALAFITVTMVATHLLGPKRKGKNKDIAFECGVESIGDARTPISIKYFLVAILFVLFDVEIIFMYPWAVNFKELGWFGFWEMLTFIALLMIGFYYIIKRDVLKWE